jgi:hypothetical protein
MRRRMVGRGRFARSLSLAMAAGLLGVGLATAGSLTAATSAFAAQSAPTWTSGQYFSAIQNVPFCDDISVSNSASLPLTGITAGATPSGVNNYTIKSVNLTTGTAQICGTNTNAPISSGTPPAMAPVATNTAGNATDSIPLGSQPECTWTASKGTVSMFDTNQDLETAGTQSAFGASITNGETSGSTTNYPSCSSSVMEANDGSGDLGGAWTVNTANPFPTPTDTNPSASQGDLASSNLELNNGCYGATNVLVSYAYTTMGSKWILTVPSPWVNGGKCAYGSLGSNTAGGNTDTTNATCPPSQADVNEGYVSCSITASSGNDDNGSINYTTMDLLFNGQPVPQQSTATLSTPTAASGGTVSVTGGTNWWGNAEGAPNSGPYGDFQSGAMYQVSAPGVFIGTSRATAVPVLNSTVTISGNTYVCTGAESSTVGPNPCTMTPGQPSGSFQVPSGLAPGSYNIYIDETNTTPLPGNGPNDAYQTTRGTNLGTAESVTALTVLGGSSTTVTSPTSSSIVLGASDTDGATVTGSSTPDPTGSVKFYECGPTSSPTACTSTSWTQFDTESLSGTANPANVTSAAFSPTSTGYWCFAAVYSGDSNYAGSSDQSTDECFDVTATGSTTVTSPTSSSVVLGRSNTDGATVTGSSTPDPTGSVKFYECGPTSGPTACTSGSWIQFDSESLSGTANPAKVTSAAFTPTSTGYWCFAAVYSGDSNYAGSSDQTTDECFDVTATSSTTVTSPTSSSIVLGATDTDGATVTGSSTPDPTGSVKFYECGPTSSPTACTSTSWTQFDTESLSGTANPSKVTSTAFRPLSTGYWCFAAVYSGDSNYAGSSDQTTDECLEVTAAGSQTVTSPTSASIVLGASNTDGATVTGDSSSDPTGSVKFYECGPTSGPTACTSSSWTQFDTESLSGTANPGKVTSAAFTPSSSGYWCFAAVYSGDSNNAGSSDETTDECFDVTAAGSQTVTSPTSASIVLGATDTDGATVTGSSTPDPTGSVKFYECGPTSGPTACTSTSWTQFDTESLSGTANPANVTSAAFTPTSTGYWCFAAVYSGDSNYTGSSDQTTDECFLVTAALPTITTFSPASGKPGSVVKITGTNLSGALKVTIGKETATITSDSSTKIKIRVPTGAKTGKITVTTSSGSAKSATNFKVT